MKEACSGSTNSNDHLGPLRSARRRHFSSARCDSVDVRPLLFHAFTIRTANTRLRIQGMLAMTFGTMYLNMALWNGRAHLHSAEIKLHVFWEALNSDRELLDPLTDNVICDHKEGHGGANES